MPLARRDCAHPTRGTQERFARTRSLFRVAISGAPDKLTCSTPRPPPVFVFPFQGTWPTLLQSDTTTLHDAALVLPRHQSAMVGVIAIARRQVAPKMKITKNRKDLPKI